MTNQVDQSHLETLASVLEEPKRQERGYDWLGAAASYSKLLSHLPERNLLDIGDTCERSGYAFYRAALQSETREEFQQIIRRAIASYEKAKGSYARLGEPARTPRTLRSQAAIAYLEFWLEPAALAKKRLVNDSWRLTTESLGAFKKAGDGPEYARTYNQLSTVASLGFAFEWEFKNMEEFVKEAIAHGEQTIKFLSAHGDPYELAKAYAITTGYLQAFGFHFLDLDERKGHTRRSIAYWRKAMILSEESALIELSSFLLPGMHNLDWATGSDQALTIFNRALNCGRKAKDKLVTGRSLEELAFHTHWKALTTEDQDEAVELATTWLQYADQARNQYLPISFTSTHATVPWAHSPSSEYFALLALFETNLTKRRELLEKAVEAASDLLDRAKESGYLHVMDYAYHVFSKTLASLAKVEEDPKERQRLLEQALNQREEHLDLLERSGPFLYWEKGLGHNYLAEIKAELSRMARDPETRRKLLQEAAVEKDAALKLCARWAQFVLETVGQVATSAALGRYQFEHGELLNRLHDLTKDSTYLRRAAEAFGNASESFQNAGLASRVAECYWKVAQAHDALGDYLEAARKFEEASEGYSNASEKIPLLKTFYLDHVSYMRAWTEIENARYHHGRQDYGSAKQHYEKAAALHESTKHWSFLAPNYSAWAQIVNAEDLSRKEGIKEAILAFEEATALFESSKSSLQNQLSKTDKLDEREMVADLLKAADLRQEYCRARILLEEGRVLDRKGENDASSERFRLAAEAFQKIAQSLESEQDRRDIKLITSLTKAWQRMARAEAEASPELFREASKLFEEAKELSLTEKAKMLALGHSRFCMALEAGTRFADTRDPAFHISGTRHLDSASDYYIKAGYQSASEVAEASERLFDGYAHMSEAKSERDPEKRAKLYALAGKVLHASAEAYLRAGYPARKDHVLRLLEKVQKERQLAVSLTELLQAPSVISTTSAFSTPGSVHEKPVGLERFEHADVQASVVILQKTLNVGEDFQLEIELVNAGRGLAQLVKIENIVPEGFVPAGKLETHRIEDGHLNMKGRQLGPLKTEEVKVILKAKERGEYTIKPRILYLDESGKYKTHEPEPVEVIVKELGLSGWVKGR